MRKLTLDDIDDLCLGATLLGTGGGGDPYVAKLVVKQDDGPEQEWSLEMGANVYLYNLGWRPSTVKAGDTLTVTVVPLRNGQRGGLLVEAKTADGKTLGGNP